jgi:hypothetical protein
MGFLRSHRKQSECPFVFSLCFPINPELIVDTAQRGVEAALEEINQLLLRL